MKERYVPLSKRCRMPRRREDREIIHLLQNSNYTQKVIAEEVGCSVAKVCRINREHNCRAYRHKGNLYEMK